MGDAADDMFDQAMYENEMRHILRMACNCSRTEGEWYWFQNEEGFYECSKCGEVTEL